MQTTGKVSFSETVIILELTIPLIVSYTSNTDIYHNQGSNSSYNYFICSDNIP